MNSSSNEIQPYFRSAWARAVFMKMQQEKEHKNSKHPHWYSVNFEFLSLDLQSKFIQCEQDGETAEFLSHCFDQGTWFFTQLYQDIGKSLLTWFMSSTSANGLLNRGSMFVLSSAQFQSLLNIPNDWRGESLLDLGAGDGNVTEKMAPFFQEIFVTELSSPMQWRLRRKGYKIVDAFKWHEKKPNELFPKEYDVISCLNLLDRCDTPVTLLRQIHSRLKPSGLLLIAMVLPLRQYVEFKKDHKASERIPVTDSRIVEVQLENLIQQFYAPLGFTLLKWTRLPYLCEGDFSQSFYYLSDIVTVFQKSTI